MSPSAGLTSSAHFQANVAGFHEAAAKVKTEWNILDAKKKNGQLAPADEQDYKDYAEGLAKGLPEIENGVIDLAQAFQSGDPLSEAESVLNLCTSLVVTVGSLVGPEGTAVGALLGALFEMISSILKLFQPPPVPLIDQIKELLKQQQADQQYQMLQTALGGFEAFEDAWKQGLWPVVNLQNGPEVQQLRATDAWLSSTDNQTDGLYEKWVEVLELQCQVFIAAVKAVPLALSTLEKQTNMPASEKSNTGGLLRIGIQTMARNQLAFLEGVAPVIQRRGIYWMVDSWRNLLVSFDQIGKDPFGNESGTNLSVAMAVKDNGEADPNLHLFSLDSVGGSVWHGSMRWKDRYLTGWSKMNDLAAGCLDVSAMPGDDYSMFYWIVRKEGITCGSLNQTPAPQGFVVPDSVPVKSVRAVHRPKSIGDDPDENAQNPRRLDGIKHLVYAGLENTNRMYVVAYTGNDTKKGFVSGPKQWSGDYFSIGLNSRFVWIAGPYNLFRASHTSILKALAQGADPNWMPFLPPGGYNRSWAACDDNTVCSWNHDNHNAEFLRYPYDYWNGNYFSGLGLKDKPVYRPLQLLKLPSYRWANIGGLIEALRLHSARLS